jgi:transcriptional regulator with XRE-family HTH domain
MQSIGEKLEEARKRRGISLREASEVTKIRSEYLGNFEANTFDIKLPEVYIRGFLRAYANFLKLNADKIITDYNVHKLGESKIARPESREFLGRMDIPGDVLPEESSGKPLPPPRHAPAPASATESGLEYNNFDKASLIKGGAAIVGAGLLVVVIIFVVLAVLNSGPSEPVLAKGTAPGATAERLELTIRAIGGDINNVTVKEVGTDRELFRGPLAQGQSQRVPFDQQVLLSYTHAQYLAIEHDGVTHRLDGQGRTVGRSFFP